MQSHYRFPIPCGNTSTATGPHWVSQSDSFNHQHLRHSLEYHGGDDERRGGGIIKHICSILIKNISNWCFVEKNRQSSLYPYIFFFFPWISFWVSSFHLFLKFLNVSLEITSTTSIISYITQSEHLLSFHIHWITGWYPLRFLAIIGILSTSNNPSLLTITYKERHLSTRLAYVKILFAGDTSVLVSLTCVSTSLNCDYNN